MPDLYFSVISHPKVPEITLQEPIIRFLPMVSFMKSITFQRISEKGIQQIGPTVAIMAEAEGLQAHKNAVTHRLDALGSK